MAFKNYWRMKLLLLILISSCGYGQYPRLHTNNYGQIVEDGKLKDTGKYAGMHTAVRKGDTIYLPAQNYDSNALIYDETYTWNYQKKVTHKPTKKLTNEQQYRKYKAAYINAIGFKQVQEMSDSCRKYYELIHNK